MLLVLTIWLPFGMVAVHAQTKGTPIYTNSQFMVSAQDSQGCHIQHGAFHVTSNETVQVSLNASTTIDFAIINQFNYNYLNTQDTLCSNYLTLWMTQTDDGFLYKRNVSFYQVVWQAPRTGTFYFIFINRQATDASVTFNAWTT